MITVAQYFGDWLGHTDATEERKENAQKLLEKVNSLLFAAQMGGVVPPVNPNTACQISGSRYGGFRPQSCPQGAPESSHKVGRGVDIYDPQNRLDEWLSDDILEAFGLYREHPDSTDRWVHLTDRPPHSGRRTFQP